MGVIKSSFAILKTRGQKPQSKTEKEAKAETEGNKISAGGLMANHVRIDSFLMGHEMSSRGAESQIRCTLQTKYVYSALLMWFQRQIISLFKTQGWLFYQPFPFKTIK